jgi:hypothetical protein
LKGEYNFGPFDQPELKVTETISGNAISILWRYPATTSMTAPTSIPDGQMVEEVPI